MANARPIDRSAAAMLASALAGRPGPGPRHVPKYAPVLGTIGAADAPAGTVEVELELELDDALDGAPFTGATSGVDAHPTPTTTATNAASAAFTSCIGTASSS